MTRTHSLTDTCRRLSPASRVANADAQRGFTLVELMLALTGGLFVSMVVFAMARDGSRFYQRESRIAEATLGNLIGFDRLRNDIARAGFLSTPNVRRDATFCGDVTKQLASYPQLLALASIQISAAEASVTNNSVLKSAGPIVPHSILLAGAYSSVDKFDIWETVLNSSNKYEIRLQGARGALARMNWPTLDADSRTQLLARLFPSGRALRIYSTDTGTFQIGVIESSGVVNDTPVLTLDKGTQLLLRGSGATRCHASVNQQVNVINLIRFTLRDVRAAPADEYAGYQTLLTAPDVATIPGETTRLELVREEVDALGKVVPESREVIAEYAVDLRFAITYIQNPLATPQRLIVETFNSANVLTVAGNVDKDATAQPQTIRSVRARLSLRSREADRDANVDTTTGDIAPGLYRIGLGENGTAPFARVRTLQADTFIGTQAEIQW